MGGLQERILCTTPISRLQEHSTLGTSLIQIMSGWQSALSEHLHLYRGWVDCSYWGLSDVPTLLPARVLGLPTKTAGMSLCCKFSKENTDSTRSAKKKYIQKIKEFQETVTYSIKAQFHLSCKGEL